MTETVRAFIAVELTDQAKNALAGVAEHLTRARIRGLRTVSPEGIHLTLKFLGNVPTDRTERIVAEVSRVTREHGPFSVELDGVGVFPSKARPRVLWVGLGGDLPAQADLHRKLEVRLAGLGFAPDTRAFSPHLTVARVRDGTAEPDRRLAAEALFSAPFDPGLRVAVEAISLMRSVLHPEGARYDRLALMSLDSGVGGGARK